MGAKSYQSFSPPALLSSAIVSAHCSATGDAKIVLDRNHYRQHHRTTGTTGSQEAREQISFSFPDSCLPALPMLLFISPARPEVPQGFTVQVYMHTSSGCAAIQPAFNHCPGGLTTQATPDRSQQCSGKKRPSSHIRACWWLFALGWFWL